MDTFFASIILCHQSLNPGISGVPVSMQLDFSLMSNHSSLLPDQDHTEWVYHPGLSGQVDSDDQDHHSGAGCGVWPQPGEGGPPGSRGLLLWEHLLISLPEVQQERGQETRGERDEETLSQQWKILLISLELTNCLMLFVVLYITLYSVVMVM